MAGLAALLGVVAWPAVAIAALLLLRDPLAALLDSFARRGFKLSARGVSVEAGALAPSPALQAAANALADVAAGGSGPLPLADAVVAAGRADYVRLDLGTAAAPRWLTSRLFLLAALIERDGAARAVVFTRGGWEFLGVATPGAIRRALGAGTPAYERALAAALAEAATEPGAGFAGREGMVSEVLAQVVRGFLAPGTPGMAGARTVLVRTGAAAPPPDQGYHHLPATADRSQSWELATPVIPSRDALRDLLGPALHTASVPVGPGADLSPAQLAEVARSSAPFLALVDDSGIFRGLAERSALLARAVTAAAPA